MLKPSYLTLSEQNSFNMREIKKLNINQIKCRHKLYYYYYLFREAPSKKAS